MKVGSIGLAVAMAVIAALTAGGCRHEPADLVVLGGKIVTMDRFQPAAEALAARGGLIVAVGSEEDVSKLVGPSTKVLDLAGAVAVPGLIEGHGHFLSLGRAQMQLDLREAADWPAIVAMVAEAVAAAKPGEWIVGRGWHQEKWAVPPEPAFEGLPLHDGLSLVSPSNPVLLTHASGHMAIVNARAMELVGIGPDTEDPEGGQILRDADGRPTGVLRETAADMVAAAAERRPTRKELRQMAEAAAAECLANGITSFQDAGASFAEVEVLRGLAESGQLPVRLWVMLSEDNDALAERLPGYSVKDVGGGYLTVGGIKRLADGALGAHGAWLLEPYSDLPDSTGLNIATAEELAVTSRIAAEHRLQLCTHAIGDRANRVTLDVYEAMLSRLADGDQRRWRIEHAQHLDPKDVGRFGELGVIAAMQPVHCVSDGPWVPLRLGERRAREGAYLWRSLLDQGAVIASGTDVPVEPIDPIATFHAAVTRRMADGSAFYPTQRMAREEALRSMTLAAAFAAFEEHRKGSLEVGKLADLTVLSQDLLTVDEDEIKATEVLATVVGGSIRYPAGP
ncbi:MAG TPA: amidohydrolase [Thermoanaerobaculales bacterium]|nr:amidohydrolase [Thermoanaerobaculales bacterium]HQP44275.1 amidohydrolase [Thermoanaerobaculales bacterium]